MAKVILHVDINQFFASATILKEPELKGKPLVIASSSRRSIVSTASYEARKFGINSAMPLYMAKKKCPELIIREPDFSFYHEKSLEFINYLKTHASPVLEQVSIDEAYVDFTEQVKNEKDPLQFIKKLQMGILNDVKLSVSIGVAATKFLAKMGSDYKKPLGLTLIRKRDIPNILYPLPIEDFYGIGKRTSPKLRELGINTIGDFARSDDYRIKELMGKFYDEAKSAIEGNSDDVVMVDIPDPKSVSSTSTFEYDTNDYDEIVSMLEEKTHEVIEELKKEDMVGKTISIILKDTNFKSISKSITLDNATDDYEVIFKTILSLYNKYYVDKFFRLVGVGISNLMKKDEVYVQISLFEEEKIQKRFKARLLVSKLNNKANKKLFILASKVKNESK